MATVSGDEVQAENGTAILKQSTLKLVQTVKKITTRLECELIVEENVLRWKWEVPQVTPPATKGKEETPKETKTEAIITEESVRIGWVVKAQVETAQPSEKPEAENGETTSDLIVHYIKRHELPEFRFSLAQAKFTAPSNICTEWETFLNEHVAKKAPQRPKSLLVILNPVSGHKKAEKIYKEKAVPVFDLFGINVELVVTKKAKESAEILENHDLSKFDGLVSVGGDGTHTEVCSALLEKTMKGAGVEEVTPGTELHTPTIRQGMIPTGSGNAQQLFGSYSRDVVTSAVVVAMGDSRLRDLMTVHCGEKLLAYGCLMIAYGLISQAMELMENNRWAGPARYLGMAFITFVKRKAVDVQLDYLPGDEESMEDFQVLCEVKPPKTSPATAAGGDQKGTSQPKAEGGEQKDTSPAEGATNEAKDAAQAEGTDVDQKGTSPTEEAKDSEKDTSPPADDGAVNGEATEKEAEKTEGEEEKTADKEEAAKDGGDAAAVAKETEDGGVASAEVVEEVEDPLPEGWKRVKGRFLGVDCFINRLDKIDYSRLYKYESEIKSGLLGLQITQPCGRMEHVKYFRRMQKGDLIKAYGDASFVKMLGVKEFRLKAIGDWRNSAKANAVDWDGDMLYTPEPHFEVKSHAQVLPTFSRLDGPELADICVKAEEELKKAALERSQSGARASGKKSKDKSAQNGAKKEENEQKAAETEKASEADGKPTEAANDVGEKTTEVKTESETEKKETDENLPKAEVEIKVTEAPEIEAQ